MLLVIIKLCFQCASQKYYSWEMQFKKYGYELNVHPFEFL